MTLVVLILLAMFGLVANGQEFRDDDVKNFESWFLEHGGRCRCNFSRDETGQIEVIANKQIPDGEATMMVPQAILLNTTVIERSPLGPSLEILSLTEAHILKERDVDKQAIMRLTRVAIYVLYSVRVQDEKWLTYFKFLLSSDCKALWSWSESELTELQDKALLRRVLKWKEEISVLTQKIAPKLKELGLFFQGIESTELVNGICAVQRNSFNVSSDPVEPLTTIVPGLNMFPYNPKVISGWWMKDGALRHRHIIADIQRGDRLHINMNPTGDGLQTLFDYGAFIPDGTMFFVDLPAANSAPRRRFMDRLKIRKQIRYTQRFTYKAAALPYFRVAALSEAAVEEFVNDPSQTRLSNLTQIFKSPLLHMRSKPEFSCKEEVVALNTLAVHLRDALSGKVTGMPEDKQILTGNISKRLRTAVSFRLKFKELVTNFLDTISARAIETKRECLSSKPAKDEL